MTSYKLAEQFGLIIHYSDDEYIYTSTPKYKYSLFDYLSATDDARIEEVLTDVVQKLKSVIKLLWIKQIIHCDLSFGNICIDNNDDLQLIDFEFMTTGDIFENGHIHLRYIEEDLRTFTKGDNMLYDELIYLLYTKNEK